MEKNEHFFTDFMATVVPFLHPIFYRIGWVSFPFYGLSITATFVWNYLDIFITMMSMGLSTLFKQLNNELEQTKNEVDILTNIGNEDNENHKHLLTSVLIFSNRI